MNNENNPLNSTEQTGFEKMQTALTQSGFRTYLLPVSSDNAVEQLLVSLDTTPETPNQDAPVIQVMFVNDLVAAGDAPKNPVQTYFLQFFVALPIKTEPAKQLEMYQLLSVFSRVMPIGYFGLGDDGIFFRHSLVTEKRELSSVLTLETVNITGFFVTKFISKIKELASGSKKLEEILESTQKELNQYI